MKLFAQTLFHLLFLLCLSFSGFTQELSDTTAQKVVIVKMANGLERVGVILKDDGREILLKTENLGNIFLQKSDIVSISEDLPEVENINGVDQRVGPFTTRYQFTTNALPIKKGEDYALVNLFGPEVHFAVTDRLTLGVMSTWIASPLVFAAKYSFKSNNENVNFGFGTLLGSSGYIQSFQGFGGLHWMMMTVGKRTRNITFSAGYGYLSFGNRSRLLATPGVYQAKEYEDFNGETVRYIDIDFEQTDIGIPRGPVFSVGGIVPLFEKLSLVGDVMLLTSLSRDTGRETTFYQNGNEVPFQDNETTSAIVVASDRRNGVLVLMPGMRVQTSEKKAFQVSLAGVIGFGTNSSFSFPIPSASWFHQF